ncbi:hypothetical protein [Kiloniella sp.]|uniref:hypothetical protein n=1 Tax=Kiloniella sp. TaxID=1938587 RepID=UPI003A9504B8
MPVNFYFFGDNPNSLSNKAEKYSLQLSARAYGYKQDDGKYINVLYPIIDKISITLPINGEDDRKAINEQIMDLPKKEVGFKSVYTKGSRYKYAMQWLDRVTSEAVLIQADPKNIKENYMRFEMNPDKLKADGMGRFKEMLKMELTVGNYTYKHLLDEGRVTRMDIAVDMINVSTNNLILSGQGKGKTVNFFGLTGEVETIYLDKPSKKSSTKKVYNKLQQLTDCEKRPLYNGTHLTRVEYTHDGGKFSKLPTIQNPFKKFSIINPSKVPDGIESWVWELFLNSCRIIGIDASLALLPEDVRAKCSEAIDTAKSNTWRPEKLWEMWNTYLYSSGVITEE